MIYTVKGFRVVNEAEVDILLEFSCFFYYPTDVGNLTSGKTRDVFKKTGDIKGVFHARMGTIKEMVRT